MKLERIIELLLFYHPLIFQACTTLFFMDLQIDKIGSVYMQVLPSPDT